MPDPQYYYVYILVSEIDETRHYTGCTENMKARIAAHNAGHVPHTSKYKPWKLETCIAFTDKNKARAFEAYLKSGSGRTFAKRHF